MKIQPTLGFDLLQSAPQQLRNAILWVANDDLWIDGQPRLTLAGQHIVVVQGALWWSWQSLQEQ